MCATTIIRTEAHYTLVAFGLLGYGISLFPLTTVSPPEPSVFVVQIQSLVHIDNMSRPLWFGCFLAGAAGIDAQSHLTAIALVATACALPLAWLLGIVPPPTAALLYAIEQFEKSVLGGTGASSYFKLFFSTFCGLVVWMCCFVALEKVSRNNNLLVAAILAGVGASLLAAKAPLSIVMIILNKCGQVQPILLA